MKQLFSYETGPEVIDLTQPGNLLDDDIYCLLEGPVQESPTVNVVELANYFSDIQFYSDLQEKYVGYNLTCSSPELEVVSFLSSDTQDLRL